MESLRDYILYHTRVELDKTVRLGPIHLRIVSNSRDFPAMQYFSRTAYVTDQHEAEPYELWCISLAVGSVERDFISAHVDRTSRGASFRQGYYITDHFGEPIYLVTHGRSCFVFGENLERVVWPYFVKYFLLLYTVQDSSLFLKSAAFAVGSTGTLLIGRGGGGKTVFLTQLCRHGASFITNSHSIIKNNRITGVASAVRVRPGPWVSNVIQNISSAPGLVPGEIIIDPNDVFDTNNGNQVNAKNLCIIDYQGQDCHVIEELSEDEAYDCAEQFSLAINVYRLEEDLLDIYQGEYREFSTSYAQAKALLRNLIKRCHCYRIRSDIMVEQYREEVFELLSDSK